MNSFVLVIGITTIPILGGSSHIKIIEGAQKQVRNS